MEGVRGKTAYTIDPIVFACNLANYTHVLVDLGTGDGRFVTHMARTRPDWFIIGIDTCRENLRVASRQAPANAQYLIADARALPPVLNGVASQISINFPWGSLLHSLLAGDAALLTGLAALAQPGALLDIWLNAGALAVAGWQPETGGTDIQHMLRMAGFAVKSPVMLDAATLRTYPTTWAKRLAFGRDPRALHLHARLHRHEVLMPV